MVETLYYLIKLGEGALNEVVVETTTTIGKIRAEIYEREHLFFENHKLSPGQLDLYAPSDLSRKPVIDLLQRARKWSLGDALDIGDEVREIFKPGLDRNLVHLVVEPRRMVATGRPIIPEGTPRKTTEETQKLVDDFLGGYDMRLKKYVAGLPWSNFWKAPSSAHSETQELINSLEIPCVSDNPMLLLHDLGKDVVDDEVVKDLFNEKSRFLVNTSGSGKTRLLFEGLTRIWGFYFTTVTEDTTYRMGSTDMKDAILNGIPKSHGWVPVPEMAANVEDAYETNYDIAKRRVHQVLTARILVFEHFLKLARATCPTRPINEFREHWLFLQLYSNAICGTDVFDDLSKILKDANEVYLMMHDSDMVYKRLVSLQKEFDLGTSFYLILDEAQEATEKFAGCFRSDDRSVTVARPVLKPIVSCWAAAALFPIIVSGTCLSIDVVNDILRSSVVKLLPSSLATNTGAFDDPERQRKYIMRYMPRHVARSDSGKEFLRRVWQYVRGRHRFTAVVLGELIKTSFASPHRVLDAYIKVVSGFTPTDGQRFSEKEVAVTISNVAPLSFTNFLKDKRLIHVFSDLIYTWLLTQRYLKLPSKDLDLVQLGFARLLDSRPLSPEATVDEPLVLLAATHALSDEPGFTLQKHIVKPAGSIDSQSIPFERLVAHYLASVFDGKRKLHEIFDFGGNVPQWAKQRAEVVSVKRHLDGQLQFNTFYLPEHLGGMTNIGFQSNTMEETEDWFKNPTSLLCFPDNKMGPDIVLFIRLESGEVLPVVVQCKWRNAPTAWKGVVIAAAESLDPPNFFGNYTLRKRNDERALASVFIMFKDLRDLKDLRGPESDIWFKYGMPMLKVIASYPAVARKHIPADCTTLNMDPYGNLLEKTGLLKALADKFTGDKRTETPDDGSAPNKKQRTRQ